MSRRSSPLIMFSFFGKARVGLDLWGLLCFGWGSRLGGVWVCKTVSNKMLSDVSEFGFFCFLIAKFLDLALKLFPFLRF